MENALIVREEINIIQVFEEGKFQSLLDHVRSEAIIENPEVESTTGRSLIKKNAALVASSKTLLDTVGKEHVQKLKEKPKIVDAARKIIRDTLDELKAEVRAPLTIWENERKAEEDERKLAAEILESHEKALQDNEIFTEKRKLAIERARLLKEEDERILTEKIKKESEAKIQAEIMASLCREATATAARNQAVTDKKTVEKQAKIDKENAENQAVIDKKKAEIDKEYSIRAEKARAKLEVEQAERDRLQKEEAELRIKLKKSEDTDHRKQINNEALQSLCAEYMKKDITEKGLKSILILIIENKIRHISINY